LFSIFGTKHFLKDIYTVEQNILSYPYNKQKQWVFLDIVPAHVLLHTYWNNQTVHYSKSVQNPPLMQDAYYLTNANPDTTFFTLIHQDKRHKVYVLKNDK
jgi:hypothetical protein